MTTVLITNVHPYADVHEAYRLERLDDWARKFGFQVIAHVTKGNPFDYFKLDLTNTFFTDQRLDDRQLSAQFTQILQSLKPTRVVNNLEIYVPWHLIHTDAERMYFFRNCAAKVLQVMRDQNDFGWQSLEAVTDYELYAETERGYIAISDTFITDSPNSVRVIGEMYPSIRNVEYALEYVDPWKYLQKPISRVQSNTVYTVGRRDYQKGLQNVDPGYLFNVNVIGGKTVHSTDYFNTKFNYLGQLPFEKYWPIIKNCRFGLFPSIWESNGYAVQECLAMGKIPLVQKGSGGNERLVKHMENGIIIDFKTEHWEDIILELSEKDILRMQLSAKNTLTVEMFENSLEKWANLIL